MALCLNSATTSLKGCLLRRGYRTFGLLGKATHLGIVPFTSEDVLGGWALTAEFGCLRLERLRGDEEMTGDRLLLPTSASYDYGIVGDNDCPQTVRSIFGLLPSELELLTTLLRRGSYPILGFSRHELKCSITSSLIPPCWPHLVVSNMELCGNVISVEAFIRVLVSSLPQGRLSTRFPGLQQLVKQMLKLRIIQRRGFPYTKDVLELAPNTALTTK
jgi:hypothetical protein